MKQRTALYAVIGLGIVSMCLAEITPALFWWLPVVFVGIARAYIIIQTPAVKAIAGEDHWKATAWVWFSSALSAWYIWELLQTGRITSDLHTSLQVSNILAIGAEWYYSQIQAGGSWENVRDENETLRADLAQAQERLEAMQSQIEKQAPYRVIVSRLMLEPVGHDRTSQKIICPHCLEWVKFGHRAKTVTHCNHVIYQNSEA